MWRVLEALGRTLDAVCNDPFVPTAQQAVEIGAQSPLEPSWLEIILGGVYEVDFVVISLGVGVIVTVATIQLIRRLLPPKPGTP